MIFLKTIYEIFSAYNFPESLALLGEYIRIVIRNRLPYIARNKERIFSYTFQFPNRPQFFGVLSEIFFRRLYALPARNISTIIDAGANIGISAVYFKWQYPHARITCFEPNPEAFAFLEKNITQNNLHDIRALPYALGNKHGDTMLFTDHSVKASTSATTMQSPESSQKKSLALSVPLRRLSDFIDAPVDLLKIDIEGAEGDVLHDLEETKKISLVRTIILEYHLYEGREEYPMGKFLSILDRNGFRYICIPLFSNIEKKSPKGLRTYMIHAKADRQKNQSAHDSSSLASEAL
ncbi:MAG: FkbM family methyltransferase [Patescibacteria group bacterium]